MIIITIENYDQYIKSLDDSPHTTETILTDAILDLPVPTNSNPNTKNNPINNLQKIFNIERIKNLLFFIALLIIDQILEGNDKINSIIGITK